MTRSKTPYNFVDINNESEGDVAYCTVCEKVGIREKLYEWAEDENFCICSRGHKLPIYERKDEGQYVFPFHHTENPFDQGSQFESIDKRKPHDRLKDYRSEEEKDS